METAYGYMTIAGWQREALVSTPTWPAVSPAQVTTAIPVRSIQVNEGVQLAFNEGTAQGYGPDCADIVALLPSEVWTCQMRYEGFEQLLACALGYQARRLGGLSLPFQLTPRVYRHLFEIDDALATAKPWTMDDGFAEHELERPLYRVRRGTAAVWRHVSVWELRSSMVRGLTLTGGLAEGVLAQFDLVGYERRRDSLTNTPAILRALPRNSVPNVLLRHGTLRLAPWSQATALQTADRLQYQSWQLTLNNQLQAAPGPRTGLHPEEYERSSPPQITLNLNLPRYWGDAAFQRLMAATPLMADLTMVGPEIGTTGYAYQLTLHFPRLYLTEVKADVQGTAPPPFTHQATLEVPPSQPAGFPTTHHLGPLQVELVNTVSRHALLD